MLQQLDGDARVVQHRFFLEPPPERRLRPLPFGCTELPKTGRPPDLGREEVAADRAGMALAMPGAVSAQTAARYEPRSAQTGVLFEVVAEHLAEFLESAQDPDEDEPSIPAFVEKAFRRFLACGDPQRGFIRLFCDRCQFEHPLAFSCKGRAICPSCAARRTEETVGHLMEHVLPDVPIRQYVLSPPFELRGLLAARSEVLSKLARIFVRAIFARMQRWAKATGLSEPRCGAVTFIQRFTKRHAD